MYECIWKNKLIILFVVCVMCAGVRSPVHAGLMENAQKHELPNGLTIISLEEHSHPIVSYLTFFKAGSLYESPAIAGISHFFEHLMFKGTENFPAGEFDRVLESNGGYSNAYTTEDYTCYHENFPKVMLEKVIEMEAERMHKLSLTDENILSEREVVLEERRLRVDNSPPGKIFEELDSLAFKAHPYQWPVIGWESSIQGYTLEKCMNYYRTYYAPNNAVVVVVGDFETGQLLDLMTRHFGSIPSQPIVVPLLPVEPAQLGVRRAEIHDVQAQLPTLALAFHVPSVKDPALPALDLLQMIMGTGESSRLYRLLVYEKQLATMIYAGYPWHLEPGLFYLYIQLRPNVDPAEVEKLVFEEFGKIRTGGVTDNELQKGKNILRADLIRLMKNFEGRGEQLGMSYILFNDYTYISQLMDKYASLTGEQVKQVATDYFRPENASAVYSYPKGNDDNDTQ